MFGWSLREIDETDIESLIPFVFEYPRWRIGQQTGGGEKQVYADQVNWL
jgi:hypothetical protein